MSKRKSTKRKSSSLFAVAVVILALLFVAIIFLVKKDQIISNFKNTGFFDRVFGTTPEFVQNHDSTESTQQIPLGEGDITINLKSEDLTKTSNSPAPSAPVEVQEESNKNSTVEEKTEKSTSQKETEKPVVKENQKTNTTTTTTTTQTAKTELQLCFVYVNPEGIVERRIVKRSVPKSDSPLTNALNLLIKGPDTTLSTEKNLSTYITPKTKLLGAKVQNGVAYLNFNEEFTINGEGNVGLINQLMQVVYTATTFSTVTSVQFLIEGQTEEYIGDGIWIGSPLSRNSF